MIHCIYTLFEKKETILHGNNFYRTIEMKATLRESEFSGRLEAVTIAQAALFSIRFNEWCLRSETLEDYRNNFEHIPRDNPFHSAKELQERNPFPRRRLYIVLIYLAKTLNHRTSPPTETRKYNKISLLQLDCYDVLGDGFFLICRLITHILTCVRILP